MFLEDHFDGKEKEKQLFVDSETRFEPICKAAGSEYWQGPSG